MDENLLKPQISVILPAYNAERYLHEAIDSILNQTCTNFELIILNDGSTDRTEEIILSYSDPRIRYIKNEQNLKLIKTLNKGIELARGKYIARMDADDISLPDRFQVEYDFMERNPDISVCSSKIYHLLSSNKIVKGHYYPCESPVACCFCSIFRTPLSHPASFFRAEVLRKYGYDTSDDALHIEAFVLWGNLALANEKMAVINDRLLYYRDNDQSICHSYSDLQIANHKKRVRYMLATMLGINISDRILNAMYDLSPIKDMHDLKHALSVINESKKKFIVKNKLTQRQTTDVSKTAKRIKIGTLMNSFRVVNGWKRISVILLILQVLIKQK